MISTANAAPLAFVLGMAFVHLLQRFEHQSIKILNFKELVEPEPEPEPVLSEEQATDEFLAIMRDVQGDDMRLQRYKPKRERNTVPLAITTSPSRLVDHMSSITTWMDDNHTKQSQRTRR